MTILQPGTFVARIPGKDWSGQVLEVREGASMRHGRLLCMLSMYAAALIFVAAASAAGEDKPAAGRTQTAESETFRFLVRRQFDAEVVKIDTTTGLLVVLTRHGKLQIDAAPGATASLRRDDPVSVELGLGLARRPSPAAQRGSEPDQAVVRERVEAHVVGIDLEAGVLTLKAAAGTVPLDLPSHLIVRFKKGESVPVDLAVIPRPAPAASGPSDTERGRRAALAGFLLGIFGKIKK